MSLTTTRGIALYVGALLGPGLLVLPGLAASLAGPASILAWAGLLVLSGLVAVVFARLGVAHPSTGGAAAYTRLGLGPRAGRAAGWCFLAGVVTGAPVVCMMGAGYLTALAGGGRTATVAVAATLLATALLISHRGVQASSAVQLGLVAVLVVLILVAVAGAVPHADAANWTPFAPHGRTAIGSAAAVVMLSFVGWEAIAPLTGRFTDPGRQLPRVIGVAFALTAVIYLALAAVAVGALGAGAATPVPLAALLSLTLGRIGGAVAAVCAIVLTVGAVNAYLTGGAALARALTAGRGRAIAAAASPNGETAAASAGGGTAVSTGGETAASAGGGTAAPAGGGTAASAGGEIAAASAGRVTSAAERGLPRWFLGAISVSGLILLGPLGTGAFALTDAVAVPSVFFLVVYLGCTLSAARVLRGGARAAAIAAAVAVLLVLAYAGFAAIPAAVVIAVAVAVGPRRPRVPRAGPVVPQAGCLSRAP